MLIGREGSTDRPILRESDLGVYVSLRLGRPGGRFCRRVYYSFGRGYRHTLGIR